MDSNRLWWTTKDKEKRYKLEKSRAIAQCEIALDCCMVGVAGFELATPCTPCKCATKLRYTPNRRLL